MVTVFIVGLGLLIAVIFLVVLLTGSGFGETPPNNLLTSFIVGLGLLIAVIFLVTLLTPRSRPSEPGFGETPPNNLRPCETNDDCVIIGTECREQVCRPIICSLSDDDCPGDSECQAVNGNFMCLPFSCNSDSECPGGFECLGNACRLSE